MYKTPSSRKVYKSTRPLFIAGRNKSPHFIKILSITKSELRTLSPLAKCSLMWN